MKKTKNLKGRIIDVSIKLFNERGTHNVTTNHIIDELGISPGTLYYYFRNKEEIIRNIFSVILYDFNEIYKPLSGKLTMEMFTGLIEEVYARLYKYRFFYMDIVMLLDNDVLLKKEYMRNRETRFLQHKELYDLLLAGGLMKPIDPGELRLLFDNLWMISDFWFSFLKSDGGRITGKCAAEGVRHYFSLIKPYLTDAAVSSMQHRPV